MSQNTIERKDVEQLILLENKLNQSALSDESYQELIAIYAVWPN